MKRRKKEPIPEPIVEDEGLPTPEEEAEQACLRIRSAYRFDKEDEYGNYLLDSLQEDHALRVKLERSIKRQGVEVLDRYGRPKPNPLLAPLKETKTRILITLRHMGLDLEPLRDGPGRPGGG